MDAASFFSQISWLALAFLVLLPLVCGLLAYPLAQLGSYRRVVSSRLPAASSPSLAISLGALPSRPQAKVSWLSKARLVGAQLRETCARA